jgi:hypothetical protein
VNSLFIRRANFFYDLCRARAREGERKKESGCHVSRREAMINSSSKFHIFCERVRERKKCRGGIFILLFLCAHRRASKNIIHGVARGAKE